MVKRNNNIGKLKLHTFVVCAYKESPYLDECVRSLKKQSLKSEIIISTSTPNKTIESIAKKHQVTLVINRSKSSHIKDFNFAYKQATTKYVTLCHQDDIYLRNFALETVSKLERCKNPLIAFTDCYEKRGSKIVKKNAVLTVKRILNFPLTLFKNSKRIRLFSLSLGNAISAPTVTYNKTKISQPLVESDFKSNIDWISWIEFAKQKGQFVYIAKPLLTRRIHASSTTTAVIANQTMSKESYRIFCMFWPKPIAKKLLKIYSKSEQSNQI